MSMRSRFATLLRGLTVAVTLTACGGSPCAKLSEKVCAVADEASCKLYTESVGGASPSSRPVR